MHCITQFGINRAAARLIPTKNFGIKFIIRNCASRWSSTYCSMMHGTHNIKHVHRISILAVVGTYILFRKIKFSLLPPDMNYFPFCHLNAHKIFKHRTSTLSNSVNTTLYGPYSVH